MSSSRHATSRPSSTSLAQTPTRARHGRAVILTVQNPSSPPTATTDEVNGSAGSPLSFGRLEPTGAADGPLGIEARPAARDNIVIQFSTEIRKGARQHGIAVAEIHAINSALAAGPVETNVDQIVRTLSIGPDRRGRMLAVITVEDVDDGEVAIRAMKSRKAYQRQLPRKDEP